MTLFEKQYNEEDVERAEGSVHVEKDAESSVLAAIPERALSWQQTAALLLLEYIVLALLALASSFQVLGMAGGVLTIVLIGLTTLYTSHVLWRYCLKYHQIRDICDVGYYLFGQRRIGWWAAFIGLLLNNLCIMALHTNAGAVALNTLHQPGVCTQVFAGVITIIMFAGSLFRDFQHMSLLGIFAAATMFICITLAMIFAGVQDHPQGWTGEPITWTVWAPKGTTFVQGMNAVLNITYTFVGQALIPSFVGDMKNPEDFPKALYISMAAELVLFNLAGAVIYYKVGTVLTTAPAYGALLSTYAKVVAALTLPTIIIVGCVYSLVTARVVLFQILDEKSIHRRQHTVKGWTLWLAITLVLWIAAYVIGQAIPFFNDLLSLMSSLFDSWFGFVFWAMAWFELYRGQYFKSVGNITGFFYNVIIFGVGIYFFGAGTYTAVQSIINNYETGSIKAPFQCTFNGFVLTDH